MSSTIFSPERQLVYEWYTPSLEKSLNFLQAFGFVVLRQEDNFAELSWGLKNRLMVEQMQEYSDQQENVAGYRGYHGNLRVLVDDVDSVYQAALLIKDAKILKELGDRYYGLLLAALTDSPSDSLNLFQTSVSISIQPGCTKHKYPSNLSTTIADPRSA